MLCYVTYALDADAAATLPLYARHFFTLRRHAIAVTRATLMQVAYDTAPMMLPRYDGWHIR